MDTCTDGPLKFEMKCSQNACGCNDSKPPQPPENYEEFPPLSEGGALFKGLLCSLGGLSLRPNKLMTMPERTIWEKLTLVVDSGASDTVIPPEMLQWLALEQTAKVGAEYELANGEVVHNLGERRCIMKISEKATEELEMAFQVVEDVHKPLLAVSSIVKQGHEVIFSLHDPHIKLSSGSKLPMWYVNGTYELDVYIKKPGFTRQSGR